MRIDGVMVDGCTGSDCSTGGAGRDSVDGAAMYALSPQPPQMTRWPARSTEI